MLATPGEFGANGWTGEVEGLQISLNAATAKLASLDRIHARDNNSQNRITDLGIPVIEATPR